jgi:LacI family transcriptional regulator
MLLELMGGGAPAQTHLRLPTQLVPRATTAPPPV